MLTRSSWERPQRCIVTSDLCGCGGWIPLQIRLSSTAYTTHSTRLFLLSASSVSPERKQSQHSVTENPPCVCTAQWRTGESLLSLQNNHFGVQLVSIYPSMHSTSLSLQLIATSLVSNRKCAADKIHVIVLQCYLCLLHLCHSGLNTPGCISSCETNDVETQMATGNDVIIHFIITTIIDLGTNLNIAVQ